ncbi:L-aspartate oxidase [Aneurinibacillus sp. Ricciae_BoGa-3]|uniref:L-aspartate oxidase n=1 Tax=Aneurinibacillus sp. Ricciae_BoGa-3 TaxID=3022697 RepID=UPI0023423A8F|nr:L-aspartate oxidase [Aneurinibacillus sp. Ricciae_BoGa-3]WCK54860.1 L-aspartate oxidase [Aneurinibacillus sp. Ricciae_BoGa-3]
MCTTEFDFVIIGSGLAGSTAAYLLAQFGSVAVVSKESPTKSNSWAAQGGIAAAMDKSDNPHLHLADTLAAGDGLSNAAAVQAIVHRAPKLMHWLMELGVTFDHNDTGQLSLGLEGAHSRHRILHAGGDATGANVLKVITEQINQHPNIQRFSPARVSSLYLNQGKVLGASVQLDTQEQLLIGRRATVLATGGAGQLFEYTTNPVGATGEGIALAYEAGAYVRNLEFIQFHPTALQMEANPRFLISEAVRGAGAHLINETGKQIMSDHPQGDLAPRDQVARCIYEQQQAGHRIFLDASKITGFHSKFPTIYQGCLKHGVDPLQMPIPVTPAAHFIMGGVVADVTGKTNVPGLYAIGEVASTGIHGANRLASNSLLECIVMAHELAEHLQQSSHLSEQAGSSYVDSDIQKFESIDSEMLRQIQSVMWKSAGIVRDKAMLQWGLGQLEAMNQINPRAAAMQTAMLILQSALLREESRGAHYRADFPAHDPSFEKLDTFICKKANTRLSIINSSKKYA